MQTSMVAACGHASTRDHDKDMFRIFISIGHQSSSNTLTYRIQNCSYVHMIHFYNTIKAYNK